MHVARSSLWGFAIAATAASVLACGDSGGGAGGASSASTSIAATATVVTSSIASSTAAQGGQGGQGGAPGCSCTPDKPICLDNLECVAVCPTDRLACTVAHTGDPPPLPSPVCCPVGSQCCDGPNGGSCAAPGDACPLFCPDGSQCNANQRCQLMSGLSGYECVDTCATQSECGPDICCPLGSQCKNGSCLLPDLSVDVPYLTASVEVSEQTFDPAACEIAEGCVDGPGQRKLLRFSLRTPNTGPGNLFLGDPVGNDLFMFSSCHNHYHFKGYAEYRLLDGNNQVVATGHKQAFCLLDFDPLNGNSPPAMFNCSFQGIQTGWSDIYSKNLPCQWVDITDVPAGAYNLEISLNYNHTLAETDYSNNMATIPVDIKPEACPSGCGAPLTDTTCCAAGDPCGKAHDGACDCGGEFQWDQADCVNCAACAIQTTCPGGCTLDVGSCCAAGDPCNLAQNGICDCAQTQTWDSDDCTSCVSDDPNCASVNTCPNGCTTAQSQPNCCLPGDPCHYGGDGWCDCSGQQAWDASDCHHCTTNSPSCP